MTEKTIEELFDGYDLDDVFNGYEKETFEQVSEEISGYDEGAVYTDYVVQHLETGRYFIACGYTNSWAEDYGEIELGEIQEVKPVRKTVTVYEVI